MGDEHPPPWRWISAGAGTGRGGIDRLALVDASGTFIAYGNADTVAWLEAPSPRVRATIQAAPDLEALLRERKEPCAVRTRWQRDQQDMGDRRDWDGLEASDAEPPNCGKCWACRVNATLARLDAAEKR